MRVVELAIWTVGILTGGLFTGVTFYSAVSFAFARAHTEPRALRHSFVEFGREFLLAMITEPFLLLFYLVGHTLPSRTKDGVPVVFVHGYFHNRIGFVGLARSLAERGFGPLYGFNYPWFLSVESNAKRLQAFLERVRSETGATTVDVVCHSMGGLVAMELLREQSEKGPYVRRLVTIATPHAGVAWRGPMLGHVARSLRRGSRLLEAHATFEPKIPVLSVFSTHDNVVHPKETSHLSKRGGRDVEVNGRGHLAILFSPLVAEHVAEFLKEPSEAA